MSGPTEKDCSPTQTENHVHTGHGPDNMLDCEGCADEYYDGLRRDMDCSLGGTRTIGRCLDAEHHGNPFRYCPVKGCGWTEPQQAVRRNDKRVTAAARALHKCPPDYQGPCWGPTKSDIDRAIKMVAEHDEGVA